MRKISLLATMVFATLAFGALFASGAFALESKFLVDGVAATGQATTTTGLLTLTTLEESKTKVGIKIDCEDAVDGIVNGKKDETTKLLEILAGLSREVKELASNEAGLSCTVIETLAFLCDNASKLAEFWPDGLPWSSEIILTAGVFEDKTGLVAGKIPGYDFLCVNSFGLNVEGLCEGVLFSTLVNDAAENDVLATVTESKNLDNTCATEGLTTDTTGEGLMVVAGKTLAVSEG